MTWLMDAAKLYGINDAEIDDDQFEDMINVLAKHAEIMLAAGMTFGPQDWLELTDAERAALALAGRKHLIGVSVLTGRCSSPDAAAKAFSEIDGGESYEGILLERSAAIARRART